MSIGQCERTLKEFCDNCEAECEKNGTVPECWGQYGNPCANYFDEMKRLDKVGGYRTMTNGDKVRQMTDEELGDFLNIITDCCVNIACEDCPCSLQKESYKCNMQEWLKQEVSEDAGSKTD